MYEIGTKCFIKSQITDFESSCPYYYKKDEYSIKCVNSPSDCKSAGFIYAYNRECRKECDEYYKFEDTTNNIIMCFQNYESAYSFNPNIKYYDRTLKQCWISLLPYLFILYDNNGDNYEVVQICDSFFYEKDSKNYCVNDCKSVNLYFEKNEKKCKSSCIDYNKDYYNPTNNECLDTCSILNDLK